MSTSSAFPTTRGLAGSEQRLRPETRSAALRRHAATSLAALAPVLAAIAVVILGGAARFWQLDLAEFKGDELAVMRLAIGLAQHGQWLALGIPSSIGTRNSALFVYLEALPAFIAPTPLALTAFVALLNLTGLALCLGLARRYFGWPAALAGSAVFATAPWAVLYARKIWEQDALPLFVLLFMLGLFLVVVEHRPRWLWLCGPAAAVALQLHPTAISLPVVGLVAWAIWPRRFPLRHVVGGGVAALLVLAPYLLAEADGRFMDWRAAFFEHAPDHIGRGLSLVESLVEWVAVTSGWQFNTSFASPGAPVPVPILTTVGDWLAWLGIGIGMVLLFRRMRAVFAARRQGTPTAAAEEALTLLGVWLVVPPLVVGLGGRTVYPHYLIVTYPAAFLALGVAVQTCCCAGRWRRVAAVACTVLLVGCNLYTLWWGLSSTQRVPPTDGYGLPLAAAQQTAALIGRDDNGAPYTMHVATDIPDGQLVLSYLMQSMSGARAVVLAPVREYVVDVAGVSPPPGYHLVGNVGFPPRSPLVRVWVRATGGAFHF